MEQFYDKVSASAAYIRAHIPQTPTVGIILGSGLGGLVDAMTDKTGNVKKCAVGKHPKSEKLGSTGQAACCARIHSRYFTGGSPSGLRV